MGDQDPFNVEDEGEEFDFCGQPCYAFNDALGADLDDSCCEHCKNYLTTQCPHIDFFLEEMEE